MGFYTFNKAFKELDKFKKAQEGFGHNVGKIRDKFTEIIDATRINKELLHSKYQSS